MRRLLLALALLCACPSTALKSTVVPGLAVWTQDRLNSEQTCQRAPELLACAERQALYLFGKAVERGHASSTESVRRKWGHPMLCLVEKQEPCCVGEICAVSSTPEKAKLPRAACSFYNSTWLARLDADGKPYDWSQTLFWELKSSIAWALGLEASWTHSTPWDSIPYPGGEATCDWKR